MCSRDPEGSASRREYVTRSPPGRGHTILARRFTMSTRLLRLAPALLLLLLPPALAARGADKDSYGDALPEGAKARLGTSRLRVEAYSPPLLSPDGKSLFAVTNFTMPRFDPVTG